MTSPPTRDHRAAEPDFNVGGAWHPYLTGPPRFDVGLRPIELQNWLLPDTQAHWLAGKNALIDQDRNAVFQERHGSLAAQTEVAELISRHCRLELRSNEPALVSAARLVSDDLVVMELRDGAWTNTACCLCSPTFFSAHEAIGKSLDLLHAPVPDGDFGLARRIGRVFTNLAPNMVLERYNWTVQWSAERYTPDATHLRKQAAAADIAQAAHALFVRIERQTIRRLPNTGAVVFTIRIELTPLTAHLAHPQSRQAFETAWQDAPDHVRAYKKWACLERHVTALLQA